MQDGELTEIVTSNEDRTDEVQKGEELDTSATNSSTESAVSGSVIDVSGKKLSFSVLDGAEGSAEGLYMYQNVFNLIPSSVGGLGRLKTLKFFANEVNLFPEEFKNLVRLECLQVKVASPSLNGLNLQNLKDLKELELSQVPPRPSSFHILNEVSGLKYLTKLSICHFSIRYLPPEIGCLNNLECLDISFNKMRSLPVEITYLNALTALKVASNKLMELPVGLSSLQRLESLDLSNNRLTSLGHLDLNSMHNLRILNLQNNKLLNCGDIPSWICYNLDGNSGDTFNEDFIGSVEMDMVEGAAEETHHHPWNAGCSANNRCYVAQRSKGWKRRYHLQQRARQQRLNSSRKCQWKTEDPAEVLAIKGPPKCKGVIVASDSFSEGGSSGITASDIDKGLLSVEAECTKGSLKSDDLRSEKEEHFVESHSCVSVVSTELCKEGENDCAACDASLETISDADGVKDEGLKIAEAVNKYTKSKRHPDRSLDNPKPSKARRPTADLSDLASKYNNISLCSVEDHLTDGFYDAGRDRPFLSLADYKQNLHLDSREVILIDRKRDEELDAVGLCAQELVFRFKNNNGTSKGNEQAGVDDLQIASLLALFVSDHFGGSDKSAFVERTRKAVSGSNYRKPFVCTCPTGNSESIRESIKHNLDAEGDIVFLDLCEKSLQSIKSRRNSIVVPIGALQFGVCRHRAILMKYLCDRLEPRLPCELVRGYLDFAPHAWNVVVIKRGNSCVRMIVDACRPHDIREESDPEYFCRYVPLSRMNVSLTTDGNPVPSHSFPSLSAMDEVGTSSSTTLMRSKVGSVDTAVKVRTLEVCGTSADESKNFEFNCLGEVRILSVLKHSCIVQIYGHQISSKWTPASDGNPARRILQSFIYMENIKGGSLQSYLQKLSRAGEKHVPVELALCIARDVACALVELHSKHIMHRDIKSDNILLDLDGRRDDGTPIVKLCDFDRAIPLRSCLHSCCIAHVGIPPPDTCVGTPRWMAPEVFRAMHERSMYGLEVDIWSFGCLLLELLTLQVPYYGSPESDIHDLLQAGKRPQLTDELEALISKLDGRSGSESKTLSLLVDVYRKCTTENPADRPTAGNLYDMLLCHTTSVIASTSLDE